MSGMCSKVTLLRGCIKRSGVKSDYIFISETKIKYIKKKTKQNSNIKERLEDLYFKSQQNFFPSLNIPTIKY